MDSADTFDPTGPLGLAWMVILFIGVLIWAFRPWFRKRRDDGPGGAPHGDSGE